MSALASVSRTARAAEHQRLARELHDRVGAGISLALRRLELYETRHGRPESRPELSDIRRALEESYHQTRLLVAGLRPREIETTIELALKDFISKAEPYCDVELTVRGDESLLSAHYRDQIFMVMREGLRNAFAHARANRVTAVLDIAPGRVSAVVEDDGVGLACEIPRQAGGLISMRARVEALEGTFEITGPRAAGCLIRIHIPLLDPYGHHAR
ncbi:sensor histidine kinase [Nonomuraea jabiensis]|uniref:Signal transduction histidine kinase n=1 Tax=Nonomuraea jabiensis TaxID=882448 RepID=A0A7W9GDD1_9ACTN|nr:histidine kinase [Nonomuraea jabiensis]MBB5781687.1 signal transduction histidine kinase [Nonomuraea jabiensis]